LFEETWFFFLEKAESDSLNSKSQVISKIQRYEKCVSNKQGRGYTTTAHSIIKAYRDKTKIEDVIKNMKSFLKIRPFLLTK
jgi:hypothetical protein